MNSFKYFKDTSATKNSKNIPKTIEQRDQDGDESDWGSVSQGDKLVDALTVHLHQSPIHSHLKHDPHTSHKRHSQKVSVRGVSFAGLWDASCCMF